MLVTGLGLGQLVQSWGVFFAFYPNHSPAFNFLICLRMPSTKGEAYLQRLGRKGRLKRVVHFDLSVPHGPASSANQRSEWCYTPTSVHMVLLPAGLLQSCPAVSQSACYKTVYSVLLVSFSLDLSLCLGNAVTTGSVRLIPDIQIDILISFFPFPKPFSKLYGWFPISRSTSWCLFFPSQSLFQNFKFAKSGSKLVVGHKNNPTLTRSPNITTFVQRFYSQAKHFYVDDDTKATELPHKLHQSVEAVMYANNCTWLVCP